MRLSDGDQAEGRVCHRIHYINSKRVLEYIEVDPECSHIVQPQQEHACIWLAGIGFPVDRYSSRKAYSDASMSTCRPLVMKCCGECQEVTLIEAPASQLYLQHVNPVMPQLLQARTATLDSG